METKVSTATTATAWLQVEGNIVAHPVLDLLREKLAEGGSPDGKGLVVANASDYLAGSAPNRSKELLREGRSILLLNLTDDDKQALVAHIGFGAPGDSEACLITSRPAGGRSAFLIYDLPVQGDIPEPVDFLRFEGQLPEDAAREDLGESGPEMKVVDAPSLREAYLSEILNALAAPQASAATTTQQPPQQQWIYNKTLAWSCPSGKKSHGHTPQPQDTYITLSYTFIVYLDSQASGQFQWLYLQVLGYQSVGARGMNEDYRNQRGWANGFLNVKIPTPSGFFIYQSSPNNVNNVTTYTSSVSFNVGVSPDGPSGGVNVSHEKSETITDWGVKQNDLNNWTFYQQHPWDARPMKASGSMVSYNAGNARYELKSLPNLSTGVMNFSTMSVWNNQKVSTALLPVTINLGAEWDYVALHNSWPSYTVSLWPYNHPAQNMTYYIDLSMVS